MAELAVHRPLDEGDVHDDLGAHPMRAEARQPFGPGEWRRRDFQVIKPRPEIEQHLRVETGADLPGKDEIVAVEVAEQQGAKADAASLRIGEAADDELLR